MGKYALLFAGCVNEDWAFDRYANDLGFMFHILTNKYGYDKDNIKVLYKYGEVINYLDVTPKLIINTMEASIDNLQDILEHYKETLTEEDEILFMFSNHGGQTDTCSHQIATINLWGDEVVYQDYLLSSFIQISAKKLMIFGQCFGGDFLRTPIPNSIMISANFKDMPSYCNIDKSYDEFFYHFISYLNGFYPKGEEVCSANIKKNIKDAFDYAKNNDRYKKPEFCLDGTIRYQVPQIIYSGLDPVNFIL